MFMLKVTSSRELMVIIKSGTIQIKGNITIFLNGSDTGDGGRGGCRRRRGGGRRRRGRR